jgi:two-component system nitrate/nitrite response regulator NarL
MRVVAQCVDGDAALRAITRSVPDVALLDRRMPGVDLVDLLDKVAAAGGGTRVLVISAYTDAEGVAGILEAGAAGYVSKDASRDVICSAIRRVADGEVVIGYEVQRAVAEHLRTQRERQRSLLSDREQEVLALLAEGLSTQQIADRLILGLSTIKTHLRNVYDKLEVNDRAGAVAEAMRRGLIR